MPYQIIIKTDDDKVVIPLNIKENDFRSVHRAKHTIIRLIGRLSKITSKGIRAELVSWDWVQDGDCVSQEMEVLFSINTDDYENN